MSTRGSTGLSTRGSTPELSTPVRRWVLSSTRGTIEAHHLRYISACVRERDPSARPNRSANRSANRTDTMSPVRRDNFYPIPRTGLDLQRRRRAGTTGWNSQSCYNTIPLKIICRKNKVASRRSAPKPPMAPIGRRSYALSARDSVRQRAKHDGGAAAYGAHRAPTPRAR